MLPTNVLIIDDEEDFLQAINERLALRDMAVRTALDGADGLRELERHPSTDVVLLDIQMPGMNGIETLRRIKASHPGVEVILLTGHATVETAIEGMKLGAFDYLLKPFEMETLLRKLQTARDRARQHQAMIREAVGKELRGRERPDPAVQLGPINIVIPNFKEISMLGAKLLMIDDEEAFVAALEKRLERRDVNVLTAYSGEDGLKKLDENPDTDVVLLDVKMPGMDGIETLRRIRAAHPLVEVIMLTGHATVETAIEGMRLGAFDYLMKPADIDMLVQKVQQAYKKKHEHQRKIIDAFGKDLRERRGA